MPNASVAKQATNDVAQRPYLAMVKSLLSQASMDGADVDVEELTRETLDKIAAADDWDSILAAAGGSSAKSFRDDLVGVGTIEITGVRFSKSDDKYSQGSLGAFAICDVTVMATGESFVATVGAKNIVAQLFKASLKGYINGSKGPVRCQIVGVETGNGTLLRMTK